MTLQDHVFAHGQAYVALSRVRSRNDIRILTSAGFVLNSQPHVHNVVYPELLDATHVTLFAPFFPIVDIHPGRLQEQEPRLGAGQSPQKAYRTRRPSIASDSPTPSQSSSSTYPDSYPSTHSLFSSSNSTPPNPASFHSITSPHSSASSLSSNNSPSSPRFHLDSDNIYHHYHR